MRPWRQGQGEHAHQTDGRLLDMCAHTQVRSALKVSKNREERPSKLKAQTQRIGWRVSQHKRSAFRTSSAHQTAPTDSARNTQHQQTVRATHNVQKWAAGRATHRTAGRATTPHSSGWQGTQHATHSSGWQGTQHATHSSGWQGTQHATHSRGWQVARHRRIRAVSHVRFANFLQLLAKISKHGLVLVFQMETDSGDFFKLGQQQQRSAAARDFGKSFVRQVLQ